MSKPVISPENLPTFVAVIFVLVLITMGLTVYNYRMIGESAAFYGGVVVADAKNTTERDAKITALEGRIAALEAAARPAEPAPTEPAPAAAPAVP